MKFNKILTNWYSINKRELPWRNTKSPYKIWLSEIILQQTQIKQGLPYYEAFVNQFPTVFDLANASEHDVLKLWQGLGYYTRARNLHHTAKYIASERNGNFPNTYKELLKLKGVGDYTASAIASICFNEPMAVVDGNVYRFLSRFFGIETPINSSKGIKEFKALANSLIVKNNPAEFNQAMMEFGATQCKPQNPLCETCPFLDGCIAYHSGKINELPVKLNKTKISKKHFNFLVYISSDGKTLLEKRIDKGIWRNLYQFPLIETQKELHAKEFSSNQMINERFNDIPFEFSLYNEKPIVHKLSHQHLHSKFWIVEVHRLNGNSIPISELKDFATPILISNFIEEFKFPM